MTLTEMVRKARENGHRWIAVDKNGDAFSFGNRPAQLKDCYISLDENDKRLGSYKLKGDWKDSLIDINQLKGVKDEQESTRIKRMVC